MAAFIGDIMSSRSDHYIDFAIASRDENGSPNWSPFVLAPFWFFLIGVKEKPLKRIRLSGFSNV